MARIKSLARTYYSGVHQNIKKELPDTILKSTVSKKDGYSRITLKAHPAPSKTFLLHRLVAIHHIPNPLNLPEVNHLKGKERNEAEYLEWSTAKDNSQHAWDTKLNKGNTGNVGTLSARSKTVEQLKNGIVVEEFGSLREVQRLTGFYYSNICKAIKNNKPYNGFNWRYKEKVISPSVKALQE